MARIKSGSNSGFEARQEDVSDDGGSEDGEKDGKTVQYSINYKDTEYASTIQWISEDYKIEVLKPYISAIICDGGEEYEELWGDDFKVLSFDNFEAKAGDGKDTFILCYTAVIVFESDKFPKFIEALEFSSNKVEAKINFKTQDGNDIDEEIWEGYSDIPVELKALGDDATRDG